MALVFPHRITLVRRGTLLRLRAVPGQRIGCLRGHLWITQQVDIRDRVLSAGEAFTLDRTGVVLVNALGGDAALAYEPGVRLHYARTSCRGDAARSMPLGAAIDCIRPRYDPTTPAGAALARRRASVEAEARWMRAQVMGLLLARAGAAIVAAVERVVVRPVAALAEAVAGHAGKRHGNDVC